MKTSIRSRFSFIFRAALLSFCNNSVQFALSTTHLSHQSRIDDASSNILRPAAMTQNRNRADNFGRDPTTTQRIIYGQLCSVRWGKYFRACAMNTFESQACRRCSGRKFMRRKLLRFTLFSQKNIFSS